MNFFGLSPGEILLILLVAMIVLGPEKLPETAASIGKWIREFRRATQELTQQFAEDNPFTEIQRALNLTEGLEPVSFAPSASATPAPSADAPAVAIPEDSPAAAPAAAAVVAPPPYLPRRSDYFDQPAMFLPIEDRWVHGSLDEVTERVFRRLKPKIEQAIAEEWAHGVPVVVPPPVPEVASNGHVEDGLPAAAEVAQDSTPTEVPATEGIATPMVLDGVASVEPKVESSDEALIRSILAVQAEVEASSSNGHVAGSEASGLDRDVVAPNGSEATMPNQHESEPIPVGTVSGSGSSEERGDS